MIIKYLIELREVLELRKNGIPTKGIIKSITVVKDSEGGKTYKPLIEFTSFNGEVYSFLPHDSKFKPPVIGEEVNVLYNERNPALSIHDDRHTYFFIWFKLIFTITVTTGLAIGFLSTFSTS